jgi:hypothetical protein
MGDFNETADQSRSNWWIVVDPEVGPKRTYGRLPLRSRLMWTDLESRGRITRMPLSYLNASRAAGHKEAVADYTDKCFGGQNG